VIALGLVYDIKWIPSICLVYPYHLYGDRQLRPEQELDRLNKLNSRPFDKTGFSYKQIYKEALDAGSSEELVDLLRYWREQDINELNKLSTN
jgi:hypothetical protein